MNGYSNNGFTKSWNGILSLTDGLGTTIENGTIITGDITGDDIVSSTVTTTSLKSTNIELTGNLTIDNNLRVDGATTLNGVLDSSNSIVTIYSTPTTIKIGSSATNFINLGKSLIYGQSNFQSNVLILGNLTTNGNVSIDGNIAASKNISISGNVTISSDVSINGISTFTNTTDPSSLFSTASGIFSGGVIIKKNLYATDIMSDNLVSGNIGCGNLNSSNNITCVELRTNTITCDTLISSEFYYKNQIACCVNIGVASFLKIPLSTSIYDTTNDVVNYDLASVLTNSNNNTIFVLPYYIITFFNNDNIIFISDNVYGSILLYETINFSHDLTCTKIMISYKTKII